MQFSLSAARWYFLKKLIFIFIFMVVDYNLWVAVLKEFSKIIANECARKFEYLTHFSPWRPPMQHVLHTAVSTNVVPQKCKTCMRDNANQYNE